MTALKLRRLTLPLIALALPVLLGWTLQTDTAALSGQNLRPYWHVFVAYAVAWVLVFGWVFSIARRLTRLERKLGG